MGNGDDRDCRVETEKKKKRNRGKENNLAVV